ncbi:unnamed protein product [Heligmosomoides polygyrus]|uniref:Uncharacterized protein n=1 Tax=Heligmosomoides polygyrus TaxID=6339 RepID=A0A183GLX8_HELPZ|nr:unnamed protein product [Heligmosomoides polygyrus]
MSLQHPTIRHPMEDKGRELHHDLNPETPSLSEIHQKVTSNAVTAQELISNALEALIAFAKLTEELRQMDGLLAAPLNLAAVTVPKFSGRIWDWEYFWNAFNHSERS